MFAFKKRREFVLLLSLTTVLGWTVWTGCSKKSTEPEPSQPTADYLAPKAADAPVIDGQADDACWEAAEWAGIDYLWLGEGEADPDDFSGRYKIVWTETKLCFLIEITDDELSDVYDDPLQNYWMDDCLEIFIDEDHSGGDHQCNTNAFAYHISQFYDAVDLGGVGCVPVLYSDHLHVMRTHAGTLHTWEVAMDVYTAAYSDLLGTDSPKAELKANKLIGFANAYCDDDGGGVREHFYGSTAIPGADKNLAWQDASVFGDLLLVE